MCHSLLWGVQSCTFDLFSVKLNLFIQDTCYNPEHTLSNIICTWYDLQYDMIITGIFSKLWISHEPQWPNQEHFTQLSSNHNPPNSINNSCGRKRSSYCCYKSSSGHTHVLTHSEPDWSNFNLMVFSQCGSFIPHRLYVCNSHLHPRDGWEDLIESMCRLEECSSLYWRWKKRKREAQLNVSLINVKDEEGKRLS